MRILSCFDLATEKYHIKVVPKLFVTKDDQASYILNGINQQENAPSPSAKRQAITETTIKDQIPFADDNEPFINSRWLNKFLKKSRFLGAGYLFSIAIKSKK